MNRVSFELIDKVEISTAFLECAIDGLSLLHEELEQNLISRERSTGGMGYYLRVCSAMVPVLRELDRLKEELDAVVSNAYQQRKGG